jgi:hypothetical protein
LSRPRTIASRWHAHRQPDVGVDLWQLAANREQPLLVVDHHRHADRERRERLAFALGNAAKHGILDQDGQVPHLQRTDLELFELRQLQAAQPDLAHARAERVRDRPDALARRRLA